MIVGHDLFSEIFEVLISRIKQNSNVNWQRIGRFINKLSLPKNGSNMYKASMLGRGRLLVDTYTGAKELVRDSDYNLGSMVKNHLRVFRDEDVPKENII